MKFPLRLMTGVVSWCAAMVMPAGAQPLDTTFTYQGELKASGTPASGLYDLRFRLYDAVLVGAQVGATLCADNVSLSNGRFTIDLDFGAVFAGAQRFVEIEVRPNTGLDCTNPAGFVILGPRQPLTGAPNALFALSAASATTATNAAQLNGQGASFYQDASNLSGGTIPDARLWGAYTGALTLSNAGNVISGSGAGITGLNASNLAGGTLADTRLSSNAALLNAAQTFSAAKTFSVAPSFAAAGPPFSVTSTNQVANLNADFLDGLTSTAFLQSIPVPLTLSGTNSAHIIRGTNSSTASGSAAVLGWAAGSGSTYGVFGRCASSSGIGVIGYATAASGVPYGVYGQANNPSASGISVYANGDFGASGSKAFRIDHPDDPANRYLFHYAAESPEIINFYSGKATLDDAGHAVVELPHYFAKINKDPRYTLTAIGAPMPMLHVAEEIDEAALTAGANAEPDEPAPLCSFRIAGGAPNAKVSWRVEALRNDRWVQKRGAPVEVDKQDLERGTYQHPELYGQPPEKGMNYEATRHRPEPARPEPIAAARR